MERDIDQKRVRTEQERSERILKEMLRQEHRAAQMYLDLADVLFVALDTHGRVTLINRKGCLLLGYSEEEVLGRNWFDRFVPERGREEVRAVFRAVLRGERVGEAFHENDVLTRNGEKRLIAWHNAVIRDDSGAVQGTLSSGKDVTEYRQARRALEASRRQLLALFENALDAFLLADNDARYVGCNPAACALLGYERGELLQETVATVSAAGEAEGFERQWKAFLAAGTQRGEYRLRRKDGRVVDVEYRAVAHILPGLHLSVLRDVTERKRAERALRESEERFRSLFESSPDPIFVEDLEGNVLDVNPAACRLHRVDRETLLGQNVRDLVPPDQREAAMQAFEKLVTGEVNYLQAYSWTVNQHAVPVEIRANRFVYQGQDAVLLIVRDISERVEATSALKASEARTRTILETTVDAVITIDERGTVGSFNPAAERIFGYDADDILGRNVRMLMPAPYREEHDGYLSRYLETGEKRVIGIGREVFGLRKDGTTFPIDLAVSEVQLEGQRLFTGIIRDISDRRRLEQAVLHISAQERQRIGRDLHDGLGSLLTGVAMGAQAVAEGLRKGRPVEAEDLEQIAELVEEAAAQVQAIARGLNPVKVEAEGLPAALQELAAQVRRMARLSCTFEGADSLPALGGPAMVQLYWIAQEAAFNAAKHAHAEHIRIRLAVEADHLVLTVRDDGIGLPEKRAGEGAGLHIMPYRAGLIEAIYSIRSLPEGGTLVTCALPLTKADPSSETATEQR